MRDCTCRIMGRPPIACDNPCARSFILMSHFDDEQNAHDAAPQVKPEVNRTGRLRAGCLDDVLLLRMLDDELNPDEYRLIDEHLDTCAACRTFLAELVLALLEPAPDQ